MTPQYILRQAITTDWIWKQVKSNYHCEANWLLNQQNPFNPMNALEELQYRVRRVINNQILTRPEAIIRTVSRMGAEVETIRCGCGKKWVVTCKRTTLKLKLKPAEEN